MNCIVLLFLLGCCGGWRNGCGGRCGCDRCGCDRCGDGGRGNCGCDRRDDCRGNGRGRETMPGCCDRRDSDRRNDCGCEEEHHHRREDCGCAGDGRESCEVPGMIPPPWQEYPGFSHRDNKDDCEE